MTRCPILGCSCDPEPVSVGGGGLIGHFCHPNTTFIPDGDYIGVRRGEVEP